MDRVHFAPPDEKVDENPVPAIVLQYSSEKNDVVSLPPSSSSSLLEATTTTDFPPSLPTMDPELTSMWFFTEKQYFQVAFPLDLDPILSWRVCVFSKLRNPAQSEKDLIAQTFHLSSDEVANHSAYKLALKKSIGFPGTGPGRQLSQKIRYLSSCSLLYYLLRSVVSFS